MPAQNTLGDSIRFKHTGASSHDGAQTDPDLCLGNHLAATVISMLDPTDATPSLGSCAMTINRLAGANGTGTGTLTADTADSVTWTPPGGSVGASVAIANGETKLVEGNDTDKWIVVTRDSATAMSSSTAVVIVAAYPNAVGFDDVDTTEQAAGDTEYRCIGLENMNAAAIKNLAVYIDTQGTQRTTDGGQLGASGSGSITTTGSFADWPDTGFALIRDSGGTLREVVYYSSRTDTVLTIPTAGRAELGTSSSAGAATDTVDAIPGIRLALDAPASQPSGAFVTSADESTAPTGPTFSIPVTAAEVLSIGDLDPNEIYGVWMERSFPAGVTAATNLLQGWRIEFDAS